MQILVFAETQSVLQQLWEIASDWDYQVVPVTESKQVWELLAVADSPLMILADCQTVSRQDWEFLKQLRGHEKVALVHCLLYGSDQAAGQMAAALDMGVHDTVFWPCENQLLRVRLNLGRKLLEYHHQNNRLREELAAVQDKVPRLPELDDLTGLANRRFFEEKYGEEWRRAMRDGTEISLILMDIDFFKTYNLTYGPEQGEACLKQVAQAAVEQVTRSDDMVARFSGTQVIVLLPNTDHLGAMVMADGIRMAINRIGIPHEHSPLEHVTVSCGFVTVRPNTELQDAKATLERVKKALSQAKKAGRNIVWSI